MTDKDLLEVLIETNKKQEDPIDVEVLKSILSVVMDNPLEEHRKRSQDQIRFLTSRSDVWKK
ncbi:MAG: hypothetical protein ACFFBD_14325 [Candidatus Hodarchaeota archaeon]